MKKTLLLVALFFLLVPMWGAERTLNEAAALAAQFTNSQPQLRKAHRSARTAQTMHWAYTVEKPSTSQAALYVFSQEDNGGFVLVSADDMTLDILGYADTGSFDWKNANPSFRWWLRRYANEIASVNEENAYRNGSMIRRASQVTAIAPLLGKTEWHQEKPFWNQCPMDLWKTSETCLTGCVATASAQVMRKWQHPAQGTGKHSYTWECCTNSECTKTKSKQLSLDFSTITFDWANMKDKYSGSYTTAQANAVATLMYACGIACDMQYGGETIGGSGAWTDDIGYGLATYFGYTEPKFITTYTKTAYKNAKGTDIHLSDNEFSVKISSFNSYFNQELEAGRPIIMGGESEEDGGHEFVCDGRDVNNKFHINWGWDGDSNGYFTLSSLNPDSYDFSDDIDALIGLEPKNLEPVAVESVSVSPESKTIYTNGTTTLTATVLPVNATNRSVTWSTSNASIATVSESGTVKGISVGTATITVTTRDGGFTASCTVTVKHSDTPVQDTLFVSPSEAKAIGQKLASGAQSSQLYAVIGYVTSPNSSSYKGFWMDDTPGSTQTFQGFNCTMPAGVTYLKAGQYIQLVGYIMNYNNQKMQIKDGSVQILSTPTSLDELSELSGQLSEDSCQKKLINGQLYIIHDGKIYSILGQIVE